VAVEAKSNGQQKIQVHIFPTHLDENGMTKLREEFPDNPVLLSLWENLKIGYEYFEQEQKLPRISVDNKAKYLLPEPAQRGLLAWKRLGEGLSLGEFHPSQKSTVCNYPIVALKIDPKVYEFKLISASEHGGKPKTAREWPNEYGLVAAINASMYKKDYKTSTGYMKNFQYTNNGQSNPKFGAFMAFNPINVAMPAVQIIDRYDQDWKKLIKEYNTVIQNYRMISLKGYNVWKQSNKIYSTAAVAIDKHGNVLFIHSRSPYSVHDLNHILLELPLDIKNAMYVEGGPEATLYVKADGMALEWVGSYETNFFEHDDNKSAWQIPNVIGIVKRK